MKLVLRISSLDVEEVIDISEIDYDSMLNDHKEILFDYLGDHLVDIYSEALDGCPVVPQGTFKESEIRERVCQHLRDTVTSNNSGDIIECIRMDVDNNAVGTDTVSVADTLIALLDSESCNGEFDGCLSHYVESCLYDYVKNGTWHIEKDRIWFGIGEHVHHPWVIDLETDQNELGFWFEDDSYCIMRHIGDFDESFLIWYLGECGCWTPELSDVLEKCPINFGKIDTVDSILRKAAMYE